MRSSSCGEMASVSDRAVCGLCRREISAEKAARSGTALPPSAHERSTRSSSSLSSGNCGMRSGCGALFKSTSSLISGLLLVAVLSLMSRGVHALPYTTTGLMTLSMRHLGRGPPRGGGRVLHGEEQTIWSRGRVVKHHHDPSIIIVTVQPADNPLIAVEHGVPETSQRPQRPNTYSTIAATMAPTPAKKRFKRCKDLYRAHVTISHPRCESVPVEVFKCSGLCKSKVEAVAVPVTENGSFDPSQLFKKKCKCCQATRQKIITVRLRCKGKRPDQVKKVASALECGCMACRH